MDLTFNPDPSQIRIPFVVCKFSCFIKPQLFCFCIEIQTGILNRSIGEPRFDSYAFILLCGKCKIKTSSSALRLFPAGLSLCSVKDTISVGLFVNNCRKIHPDTCPCLVFLYIFGIGFDISFNPAVTCKSYRCVFYLTAFTLLITNIKK